MKYLKTIFGYYNTAVGKWIPINIVILTSFAIALVSSTVFVPLLYAEIINLVTNPPASVATDLWRIIAVLIALFVIENAGYRIGDFFFIRFKTSAGKKIYDDAMSRIPDHSYEFFANTPSGALIAQVKRFVQSFYSLYNICIWSVWFDGLRLSMMVGVLWYHSWVLSVALAGFVIIFGILVRILLKYQIPKGLAEAAADSTVTARMSDILTNIITLKTFSAERREMTDFREATEDLRTKEYSSLFQQGFWNLLWQGLMVSVFEIGIMSTTIWLWLGGHISSGVIVLVQLYVIGIFDIVWNFGRTSMRISEALTDASELMTVLEKPIDIQDTASANTLRVTSGAIDINAITFAYSDSTTPVFDTLHLSIKSGEKVALVGHSGSGKTTLVKLLLRFFDVQKGFIAIDGQHINTVTQNSLREHIAYVSQEPALFHRTIRENIAYGRPDASMDEIIAVAKKAHAHEFISKLPNEYESIVGERGIKLSGGERQRVAIARAMLKNAPIIILDEATSALDSISEQKIQDAFMELMKGKTTIVIAHRLSTIQHMDRIVVFNEGNIIESGSHKELLAQNGAYAELWNSQVGGFIGG